MRRARTCANKIHATRVVENLFQKRVERNETGSEVTLQRRTLLDEAALSGDVGRMDGPVPNLPPITEEVYEDASSVVAALSPRRGRKIAR